MKTKSTIQKMRKIMVIIFLCATHFAAFADVWPAGTYTLANGSNFTNPITLTGNVIVSVGSGSKATISGDITGSFSLTKKGAGELFIEGTNNYSGGTIVEEGFFSLSNYKTIGSITGNVEVKAGGTFIFKRSNPYTFPGSFTGTGAISINGGSVLFTGSSPFTGEIQINSILTLGTSASIASASMVVLGSGATLDVSSNNKTIKCLGTTFENAEVVLGSTRLTIGLNNADDCGSFSGKITGTGGITKEGTGKLTFLKAKKDYTGLTIVNNGTLNLGNLAYTGELSSPEIQLNGTNTKLSFEPASEIIFNNLISGTGSVDYRGSTTNRLILTANNTYSGLTRILSGVIRIGNGGSTGAIGGNIEVIRDAYLDFNRSGVDYTYSGSISGQGNVGKYNTAKVILTGTNTYDGITFINDGILQISGSIANSNEVGVNSNTAKLVIVGNKTIHRLKSSFADAEVQLGAYTLTINTEYGSSTFAGKITGTGGITKKGINNFILTGNNSFTGVSTIETGQLSIGNGGTTGTITGNVDVKAGAALIFNRSTACPYSGIISGAGDVGIEQAAGLITFNGDNTYTGATNIGGKLALGASGTIAASSGVALFHGTSQFDVSSNDKVIKKLSNSQAGDEVILGSKTLTIGTNNSGDCGKYSGKITGTGGITKDGAGKWTIAGATKGYTGKTIVRGGTLQLGDGLTSGELNNTAGTGGVELNSATAKLRFEPAADITFSKVISGTGSVEYKGSGTKKLSLNANNTYSGETIIEDGVLTLLAAGHIASSSAVRLNSNTAKLTIEGNKTIKNLNTTFANAEVALGANTLTINTSGDVTFAGRITGAGGITKTGTGTLILTGENSFTGVSTIETGQLWIGNNTPTGSITGNVDVKAGAALLFNRSTACSHSGIISGAGDVGIQQAAGVITLNGANTYTGATNIGGKLTLGASGTIAASSNVTLFFATSKLDVSSNGKFIKQLNTSQADAEVALSSSTSVLYIGTSQTSTDGNGDFKGKFTGIGNVVKQGTGTFTMSGANGATGNFDAASGKVIFSNKWAGNFFKSQRATLDVVGNVTVGGTLTLHGGDGAPINMNLSGTPSKLTATGALSAAGNPNIVINPSAAPANQVLIQAASGINAANFTLTNGQPSQLTNTADGKQLLLSSTVKTVSVDPQSGTVTAGTGGAVTFPVRTANIGNGAYPVTLAGAPAGVTAANLTIAANAGTLTLTVPASVAANTYTLTITVDGATSPGFSLVVSPAAAVFVTGITVTGAGGATTITTNGGTLQMSAAVTPTNATNQAVTWTVAPASGVATINASGLLTATGNGTVTVRATAKDGSGVYGERLITVSGQYIPTAPTITGPTALSLVQGYAATSTDAYTITGEPAPGVTKTSGNASITWNTSTLRLNIAAGLVAGTYPVTLTASNGVAPDATLTFTLTVTNPTALEVVEQQAFKAWTQNGMLHISGLTPGQSWSVYNLSGQLVYQAVAKTEEAIVPLAAQGVYIVTSGGNRVKLIAR